LARRRQTRGRNINGILLLDKPKGISSNEALQQIKRIFHAKKAGHTGSLDPLATGLLPICFGEATKFANYMLGADKSYATQCKLGITTETADTEGKVLETRPVPELDQQHVVKVLDRFLGETLQTPPMYSALKKDGQPLYKLAREGIEVDREPRPIWIERISLTRIAGDQLDFDVSCSKGTYIRTLCEDIGKMLGCGGHVTELRRFGLGVFHIDDSVTLEKLNALRDEKAFAEMDDYIQPIETALSDWPALRLTEDSAFYLMQGQAVQVPKAPANGVVTLFNSTNRFMGIGEIQDDGKVKPSRLLKS